MNQSTKSVSISMIAALCFHCATSQQGVMLSKEIPIAMHCLYTGTNRSHKTSDVECAIENMSEDPVRLQFHRVSAEDPSAEIKPADVERLDKEKILENVVVILGVVMVIGILAAIIYKNKSTHIPQIHFGISDSATTSTQQRAKVTLTEKQPIPDAIELPAHGSAILLFSVKHGQRKPETLVLEFSDSKPVRVPIKAPFGHSSGRSDFDY